MQRTSQQQSPSSSFCVFPRAVSIFLLLLFLTLHDAFRKSVFFSSHPQAPQMKRLFITFHGPNMPNWKLAKYPQQVPIHGGYLSTVHTSYLGPLSEVGPWPNKPAWPSNLPWGICRKERGPCFVPYNARDPQDGLSHGKRASVVLLLRAVRCRPLLSGGPTPLQM